MATGFKFHIGHQSYLFSFRIVFSLLCLVFFSLFCVLGVWQLHRYEYKKLLLTSYESRLTSAPIPLAQLIGDQNDTQFKRATVTGHYVNELTMFVQNQYYQNQLGFNVLTPFKIPGDKKLLLIDRGWVEKSSANLPNISAVLDEQQVMGYVKFENEFHFILGKNILNKDKAPIVMQKIDIKELQRITNQEFYPYVLRLDPSVAHGFSRNWVIATIIPEKHMGYAIQWFVMAFVLLIAYLCFCCERIPNEK